MAPQFEKKVIGRGAAYIYVETIASIISGYIFWIIMSKIATTEIIGMSSTMVSFASIVSCISHYWNSYWCSAFYRKELFRKKT